MSGTNGAHPAFACDHNEPGLSKREYFAACALTGAMADPHAPMACFVAAQCVAVADMLIDALNDEVPQ